MWRSSSIGAQRFGEPAGWPPGIAKVAPTELVGGLHLPVGYQLVEVGLDVLLVEVATNVIHDVPMDVLP